MITISKQISEHFHSSEFVCQHCGAIKIDENLVNKMENIFTKLNASKCIISSGYRCPAYDKQIGGFVGRHAEGLAADCIYYDKDGAIIPSKYVICAAYDLGQLKGIAKINDNYTHLDNRSSGYYRGDETVSNNSIWHNPYDYFGVSKSEMAKYTGEETIKYLSNKNYKGTSIVDALNQIGVDSSYSYRSKLAQINGITNYRGTAEQNTKMLEMLKNGALKSV